VPTVGGPRNAEGAGTLYRWREGQGQRKIADIRAYQSPDGSITTVARVMPRTVRVARGLGEDAPPAGTPMPSEPVVTSVTVGADGFYYIGELRGFPVMPRTSQIWRVNPDAQGAVCSPWRPNTGLCTRVVRNMTSVVGLQAGPGGSLFAVDLAKKGCLKAGSGDPADAVGSVVKISHDRNVRRELGAGAVTAPGDVAVGRKGQVFVTTPRVRSRQDPAGALTPDATTPRGPRRAPAGASCRSGTPAAQQ
jgi:hypothetical protein